MLRFALVLFGNIQIQTKSLLEKLNTIQKRNMITAPINSELTSKQLIRDQLTELLKNEEIMWAQKARANWLQLGDRNTKYLRTFANIRRKRNEISKVKDSNGLWWVKGKGLKEVSVQDFKLCFLAPVSLVKTQSIIL